MVDDVGKIKIDVEATKHVVCEIAQAEIHDKALHIKPLD